MREQPFVVAGMPISVWGDVAVGEGGVWAIGSSLWRIDPVGNRVAGTIRVPLGGGDVRSVAAGEGGVWITDNSTGVVTRVDPRTGKVVANIRVAPAKSGAPLGVAVGEGEVWAETYSGTALRIDPSTNRVLGRPVTVTADWGLPWILPLEGDVVGNFLDGTITRIDPATLRTVRGIVPGIRSGIGSPILAVGQGSVWLAATTDDLGQEGFVWRIDERTHQVIAKILVVGVFDIVANESGVWVATKEPSLPGGIYLPNPRFPPSVYRIDPSTNDLSRPLAFPLESELRLAVEDGGVWVGGLSLTGQFGVVRVGIRA
jgi:DNA-binding beta-propeller fold protein YncE